MYELQHQRRRGCGQRFDWLMPMRHLEQLERQRIAVAVELLDVSTPHKRDHHSKELARRSPKDAGDLVERQASRFSRKQFEDVEALVECRDCVARLDLRRASRRRTCPLSRRAAWLDYRHRSVVVVLVRHMTSIEKQRIAEH